MTLTEGTSQRAAAHLQRGKPGAEPADGRQIRRLDLGHAEFRNPLQTTVRDAGDLDALLRSANRLADRGDTDAAIAAYRSLLSSSPECVAAWFNLGRTLQDANRLSDAVACYVRTIDLEPGLRDAGLNLGIVFREMNCLEDALRLFDLILEADPQDAQTHLQRALTRLTAGDFAAGWDEYEWRWKALAPPLPFRLPLWDGSPMPQGTLFVHAEQGIGDEIMFASCLSEAAACVRRCIVECDPRLVSLFARSFPDCDVFPTPAVESDVNAQISIGSLPRFFRRKRTAFPEQAGDLRPNLGEVRFWQSRFASLGEGRKVGVSWSGGRRPDVSRRRSTRLDQWLPVLQSPGTTFIPLQAVQSHESQVASRFLNCESAAWQNADLQRDIDRLAAQIAALDLVVTVDNSTAHLAGALGTPVWTLLPFAADFRWLRDTDRSVWYPSMRLFRQPALGDWDAVFASVAKALVL